MLLPAKVIASWSCLGVIILFLCFVPISARQQLSESKIDGPVSVSLGDVYKKGTVKIEETELSALPSLPDGFVSITNKAYRITSDAIAAGPYIVGFAVDSIRDEDQFRHLRVLHAEQDEFDPDTFLWRDRTAVPPKAPGPDFSQKKIYAYSEELEQGLYVIASLRNNSITERRVADLAVVTKVRPELPVMPADLQISISVKNNGPQLATDVGAVTDLNDVTLNSVTPSQGTCKQTHRRLYCKLGGLTVGQTATIEFVVTPHNDSSRWYSLPVTVGGSSMDTNLENNNFLARVMVQPDPNRPPTVTLESPATGELFERDQPIRLMATAKDDDGSISKVDFLDDGRSIGTGVTSDGKHFSMSTNTLSNGAHVLTAVATDNRGRRTISKGNEVFVMAQ